VTETARRDPYGMTSRPRIVLVAAVVAGLAVGPDGDLLYDDGGRLRRLDLDTGETIDLGEPTSPLRDW
jgi:hypothetical protein